MSLIVRYHALNPTMKAREDVPVVDFTAFLTQADAARFEPDVSGITLVRVCSACRNEEVVAKIQTQLVREK